MKQKIIGILGSTGSVGRNTIEIVKNHAAQFKVKFLTADNNYELLAKQALDLHPEIVVINNENHYSNLKALLRHTNIEVLAGRDAILKTCLLKCDIVMAAIVGFAGLEPVLNAISSGSNIALANKECLVCAGNLITSKLKEYNVNLIPVDSEHSAIMQVFDYKNPESIEKIILTASGGPFLNASYDEIKNATVNDALSHPNWKMGKKISIDSATMFNKGLELIEAYHLFPVTIDQIEIIVHKESIIHSMVSYNNGSTLAQLANHDMKVPISIALFWPEKIKLPSSSLDFTKIGTLSLSSPDEKKFPSLRIVREIMKSNPDLAIILNAANEIAVESFLLGKINFIDIASIVEEMLNRISPQRITGFAEINYYDLITREKTLEFIKSK